MAAPFITQARSIYPTNANLAPQLQLLGDTLGGAVQAYKRQQLLGEIKDAYLRGDLKTVGAKAIEAGDLGTGLKLLNMQAQQEASRQFATDLGGVFGPGAMPAPGAVLGAGPTTRAAPTPGASTPGDPQLAGINGVTGSMPTDPGAPVLLPRPPVQSSSRVWGDKEAEAAGIYERPGAPMNLARVAQAPSAPNAPAALQPRPVQTQSFTSQNPTGAVPIGGSLGGISLDRAVPMLLRSALNPNLPKEQQETARFMLGKAMDQYPQEIRQLEIFRQRPDLFKMAIQLKQAGAMAITNDMRAENAEAAGIGKGAADRANTTINAATAATKTLASINRQEALLSQVQQGKVEPARQTISAWARSLGLDDTVAERLGLDPRGVGSAQALQALTAESVIGRIGAGGFPANNFSDADRQFLLGTVPQLGNDERGNKIILETGRRVAQLDIQKAKEWQDFRRSPQNKGKSYDDFEIAWADKVAKQDRFGDLRKQAEQITGPPRAQSGQGGSDRPPPGAPPNARKARDNRWYVPDPDRPGKYLEVR